MVNRRWFIGSAVSAAAYFGLVPWKRANAWCFWESNKLPKGVDPNPLLTQNLDISHASRRQNQFMPKAVVDANDFRFGSDGTFTFFHLSDFHRERADMTDWEKRVFADACERFRPSLAIVTGDNVNWRCKELFESAASPLVKMFTDANIPFALTFGNHDTEAIGDGWYTAAEQWKFYANVAGKYFVDRRDTSVIGGGVQAIDVKDADGQVKFRLCVMDSGDYGPYVDSIVTFDSVRSPSVAWARKTLKQGVPSLFFQHIVVPETRDPFGRGLLRAAKPGEKAVQEKYCHIPYVANEERSVGVFGEGMGSVRSELQRNSIYLSEGESVYEVWKNSPAFRGAYFGHDHVNSIDGITTDGVRLGITKTMSTCAYNDKSLSLRVFRLHKDGTYETDTIGSAFPNGTGFLGKLSPLKSAQS